MDRRQLGSLDALSVLREAVTGLPYIVAYVLTKHDRVDVVAIVRVIHTSRDWTAEEWQQ